MKTTVTVEIDGEGDVEIPASVAMRKGGAHQGSYADPQFLTIPEAAAMLTISRRTLEREIAEGKLPTITLRRARRIARRDLDDYIARSRGYAEQIECRPGSVVTFGGPLSSSGDNALRNLLERERGRRTRLRSKRASAPTTLPDA